MKVKQTLLALGALLSINAAVIGVSSPVLADCLNIKTSIIECPGADNKSPDVEQNAIWKLMIQVLNIMIAGVGILAVGGIVYGAVLYASAADRPEQTKKAKEIILNVVVGLIAFGLMYSFLNFLIPGGIFN